MITKNKRTSHNNCKLAYSVYKFNATNSMLNVLIKQIIFGKDYKPGLPHYTTNKFNRMAQNSFSHIVQYN